MGRNALAGRVCGAERARQVYQLGAGNAVVCICIYIERHRPALVCREVSGASGVPSL